MNETLMAPDDCRHCCGMGRVPYATEVGLSGFAHTRYKDCPDCEGSGKKKVSA